ncbi:MAG: hypothetical protein ACXWIN_10185 [Burkholderiaceae bacterium]
MDGPAFISLLEKALEARASFFDAQHESAFRLFNGFTEGELNLVIDLYASTLVIHNYAADPAQGKMLVEQASQFLQGKLVWLRAGIVKIRNATTPEEKRGHLIFGEKPDTKIKYQPRTLKYFHHYHSPVSSSRRKLFKVPC